MPAQTGGGAPQSQSFGGTSTSSTTTSSTIIPVSSSASGSLSSSSASLYTSSSPTASPSTSQIAFSGSSNRLTSNGLSAGTVAGAVVGAAVGGAILAFVLTFMFMRTRRQEGPRQTSQHSEKRHTFGGAKGLTRSNDDLIDVKHAWERHLPQPADDNSIRLTIKTLLHQVELHVENFYTNSPAPMTTISEEAQIELLKLDSPLLPKSVTVLLPQARSKTALIKHCLAHLIVSNITAEGTSVKGYSFLPSEFISVPQALSRTRTDPGKPAFAQTLSRWRVLTSYLHPTLASDPEYLAARDPAIAAAVGTFCAAFSPWSSRAHNHAARFQNLTTIMQNAADAGVLIFAQPAGFSWTWNVGGNAGGRVDGGREIVVTPGFVKVTNDDAMALERPQVMVQPVLHGL